MGHPLRVELLGRLAFESGGTALHCASRRALLLAAHVMFVRAATPRARLAGLIWGAESPRHAQGSLRVALTKLPAEILDCLDVTREEIGVAKGAKLTLDVDTFVERCASVDPKQRHAALAMYAGDFFAGAEQETAPEFSDWLMPERARVKQVAHEAFLRTATELHSQGERGRARDVVDAWLRHDPACESMHRLLMGWLPADQALAHYEVYRRARAVEHGAAPSEDMAAHADRLRRGAEAAVHDAPVRLTAATSFIGRTDEIAELGGLLADPSCRLLTIHGLGGVGKTRLASAIAELEGASFPDGIHVVALAALQSPALFAHTVARACGLHPSDGATSLELLAGFLGDHATLLVLDNLEHLLGEDAAGPDSVASQVAWLLGATGPRVKVLATSREPLDLQEEWVYELEGLGYPRIESAESTDAQAYPAVQFFAQRARQSYVGFSLGAELPNVLRICAVVEGMPLALELAASWVRNVPCGEIAASLAERATQLRGRHVNRASRHASLGAVVAYSWERLPAEQRDALSGLAVLRGTFSRDAAEHVAHASLRTLSALADRALLQRAPDGRWHIHEVVRQFAWEQQDATPKARSARQALALRQRDAYYIEHLRLAFGRFTGPTEAEALAAIELDLDNIRAAWASCARLGQVDALEAAAPAWFDFLDNHRFAAEGRDAACTWRDAALAVGREDSAGRARIHLANFQQLCGELTQALATSREATATFEDPGRSVDHARALIQQATVLSHLGRLADAEELCGRAIATAEALDDPALLVQCLTVTGFIVVRVGKGMEARNLQQRALEVATRMDRPSALARVNNNLAFAENFLGDYRAAKAGYERALALWKELRTTRVAGLALHNLGVVAQRMGDFVLALERYREGLDMFKRAGDRKMIAINLMSTGDSLVRIGRPEDARAPLAEALRIAERDAHALPIPFAHAMMAHAEIALGNYRVAASHLATAFESAERDNFIEPLAESVVNAARLVAAATPPRAQAARGWMLDLVRLPETSARVRDDATRLAESLGRDGKDAQAPGRTLVELVREARSALQPFFISPLAPSAACTATYAGSLPSAS